MHVLLFLDIILYSKGRCIFAYTHVYFKNCFPQKKECHIIFLYNVFWISAVNETRDKITGWLQIIWPYVFQFYFSRIFSFWTLLLFIMLSCRFVRRTYEWHRLAYPIARKIWHAGQSREASSLVAPFDKSGKVLFMLTFSFCSWYLNNIINVHVRMNKDGFGQERCYSRNHSI